MGQKKRKGERGAVTNYVSRNQALKKLQLSLPDFRRLCILKGIYPREPKNKKKVNKGSTANKTYYYVKDIQYLLHEPVLDKFREFKVFIRKLKKALGRDETSRAAKLEENKPVYSLDHIVKERYPTFIDAVRDLDDVLSMVCLFAMLPQTYKIKVFISIKGIYYQVEIQGQPVTWIVPHQYTYEPPSDVDFRVMLTFLEFYTTLLGFINFHLYHSMNIHYPPKLVVNPNLAEDTGFCDDVEMEDEKLAALTNTLATLAQDHEDEATIDEFTSEAGSKEAEQEQAFRKEREELEAFNNLFSDQKIFISREVPREPLTFIVRSFGGEVSWDPISGHGAPYKEGDQSITMQIMDRPLPKKTYLSRHYVQPQWVFDCVNARKILPIDDYMPGSTLPPHLSPFVEETEEDYVPPERQEVIAMEKKILREENAKSGKKNDEEEKPLKRKGDDMTSEEKKLAVMMMPTKKRKLYDKILYSKKQKAKEKSKLKKKREDFEQKKKSKQTAP
eukprot:gene15350-6582_t